VEACAGSGKTWLLSSRIARALLEGAAPRSILALTFTNKAAAEMRTRVTGHLKEMAELPEIELRTKLMDWGLGGRALEEGMASARTLLSRYLLDPQPPVISTFHSWYTRLAAMAPLSIAGIATRALSQRSWDLLRQAWQLFYAERAASVPYAELVGLMGDHATRQAMEDWVSSRVEWTALGSALPQHQVSVDVARAGLIDATRFNQQAIDAFYRAQASRAAMLAQAFTGCKGRESLVEMLTRWQPSDLQLFKRYLLVDIDTDTQLQSVQVGTQAASDPNTQVMPLRFRMKGGSHVLIRKGTELERWKAEAQRHTDETHGLIDALIALLDANDARLAAASTQALWLCGHALAQCMDRVMSKSHEIDFTGLELTAWQLMAGEPAAAFHERLDQTIAHVLVDEFQDTNPVQWGMLRAWLGQYVQADDVLRAQAPKVFLVGDPKQTIYRFRRADPEVFRVAAQWLAQNFGACVLPTNTTRRCGPNVVEFLNAAMPGADPSDRFAPHESHTENREGFVARLPLADDSHAEGMAIARALSDVKSRYPQIPWSEMRILVRSRAHMAHYEQALAAGGIPFISDRSGGLLNEPEVRDVVALLRFLAFPWSDVDCAHALKSPVFGWADAQLAHIAWADQGPTFFEKLKRAALLPGADPAVTSAAQTLTRWIDWSTQLPVHDLLDRIIHQQDGFERMAGRFARGRGLQCIANLEAFIALALDLDTGRLPSLARFLQELHRWSLANDADAPGPGVMPAGDAVQLSTIHGAKGLEADVVVLAGLMDRERSDSGVRWLMDWNASRDHMRGVAAWRKRDPMTPTVMHALQDDQRQSDDEDFNLLYVGCTRAKRILIFSAAGGGEASDRKWFGKIEPHCEEMMLPAANDADVPAPSWTWRGMMFEKIGDESIVQAKPESLAIRQGKALHRWLEFGTQLRKAQALRLMAPFALPKEAQQAVIHAAERIGETEFAKTIFSPGLLAYAEREWPQIDSVTIARPDRIVRISTTPETWWIVDFKWQVLTSEMSDYAAQLSNYRELFQSIRPNAKVEARIVTADAGLWALTPNGLVCMG
jgi:ATP-dependent helicase/nuclease subunit A